MRTEASILISKTSRAAWGPPDISPLAPDGLTPKGGYPGNDDDGRRLQAELDRDKLVEDFAAAVEHLRGHSDCTGKVGIVGFCFGGFVVNAIAVRNPNLAAGVSF